MYPQSLNDLLSTLEQINFFECYPPDARAMAITTFKRRYPLYQGRHPLYAVDYLGAGRLYIYPGRHEDCVRDAINCTFGILSLENYREEYANGSGEVRMTINGSAYSFTARMGPGGGEGIEWIEQILFEVTGGLILRNTGGLDYGEKTPMTQRVWDELVKLEWAPVKYHKVASSFEGPPLSFGCK